MGRVAMTVLDGLSSLIGFSETCVLAAIYAGRSLYVPKVLDGAHPLALLIGLDAAQVLVSQFGGGEAIKIPAVFVYDRYANMMRAKQLEAAGLSVVNISRELKVSPSTVYAYLRQAESLKVRSFSPSGRNKKHQKMTGAGSLPPPSACESPDPQNRGQDDLF